MIMSKPGSRVAGENEAGNALPATLVIFVRSHRCLLRLHELEDCCTFFMTPPNFRKG